MVLEAIKKLSLNELIATLHDLVASFSRGLDKLVTRNNELSIDEIDALRDHVKERLQKGEETAENEKLLKLITLLKEDKKAFRLIQDDVKEWIEFLDAIKAHVDRAGKGATEGEKADIKALEKDLSNLQTMLRAKN
jgi:hypothetical protein